MAKGGSFDFSGLAELQKSIGAAQADLDRFIEKCSKELAARLLAKVIKKTPVGQYSDTVSFTTSDGKVVQFKTDANAGRVGGNLRRGWTGGKQGNATSYAKTLAVTKAGNKYTIEIVNPVEYASYVEYGHRTANHKGWVEGKFMLTVSENEIKAIAPALLEKRVGEWLRGIFDD